jgi:hypothetical protein
MPNTKINLNTTAPKLLALRDIVLTVPGRYDPQLKVDDQDFISNFHPVVDIVPSKQLPRKISLRSFKKDFDFLLKGSSPEISSESRPRRSSRRRANHAIIQSHKYPPQPRYRIIRQELTSFAI